VAVAYEPYAECAAASPGTDFRFEGYDIMDREVHHSLLLNCGRFPEAFSPSDLNSAGLLPTVGAATVAKGTLLLRYAEHDHVPGCGIWALWTMDASTR
jgi:hypothetical protein